MAQRLAGAARSPFTQNIGRLAGFTVAGQLLTLASAPVLSRLYSPEDFGLYGVFMAFALFASVLTTLFYDGAIPAAHDEEEATSLVVVALGVALLVATLLTAIYLGMIAGELFGFGVLPLWSAALMWPLLISQGLSSTLQFWFVRQQRFGPVGQGIVALNAARAGVQVLLGVLRFSWAGLAVGETAGRLLNSAWLWRPVAERIHKWRGGIAAIRSAMRRHRSFPLVLLPAMTIDTLINTFLIAAINMMYGTAAAGIFFLMRRVLDLPIGFVAKTFADVFHGRAADCAREHPDRLPRFVLMVFGVVFIAASIGLIPLIFIGPPLFEWVFGEEWRGAGLLAAIMAPAGIMTLAVLPISRVFAVTNLPALRYVFTVTYALAMILALTLGWYLQRSLEWTVTAISAGTVLSYALYFLSAYAAALSVRRHGPAQDPEPQSSENPANASL